MSDFLLREILTTTQQQWKYSLRLCPRYFIFMLNWKWSIFTVAFQICQKFSLSTIQRHKTNIIRHLCSSGTETVRLKTLLENIFGENNSFPPEHRGSDSTVKERLWLQNSWYRRTIKSILLVVPSPRRYLHPPKSVSVYYLLVMVMWPKLDKAGKENDPRKGNHEVSMLAVKKKKKSFQLLEYCWWPWCKFYSLWEFCILTWKHISANTDGDWEFAGGRSPTK